MNLPYMEVNYGYAFGKIKKKHNFISRHFNYVSQSLFYKYRHKWFFVIFFKV